MSFFLHLYVDRVAKMYTVAPLSGVSSEENNGPFGFKLQNYLFGFPINYLFYTCTKFQGSLLKLPNLFMGAMLIRFFYVHMFNWHVQSVLVKIVFTPGITG